MLASHLPRYALVFQASFKDEFVVGAPNSLDKVPANPLISGLDIHHSMDSRAGKRGLLMGPFAKSETRSGQSAGRPPNVPPEVRTGKESGDGAEPLRDPGPAGIEPPFRKVSR